MGQCNHESTTQAELPPSPAFSPRHCCIKQTPEAIAIETFLDEQNRASTGKGSLRQGDLPHLWKSLQMLDEHLSTLPLELTSTRSGAIAEEWQRAFEIWNTMAREAAQYLANMLQAAQQGRPDFEAFQSYKAAVVAYVHGFAQALTQYSRRIRTLLNLWNETGKIELLVEIIAQHLEPPAPTLENRSTQAELLQEARKSGGCTGELVRSGEKCRFLPP